MRHLKILANELIEEVKTKLNPHFSKIQLMTGLGVGEGFHTACENGILNIGAESPLAAAYALNQLKTAVASGHLSEFLGKSNPRFQLRPIWVGCGPKKMSDDGIGFTLPHFFYEEHSLSEGQDQEVWKLFCKRIIELGYNAVILGQHHENHGVYSHGEVSFLSDFCNFLQEFGIKSIVKPTLVAPHLSRCPLDAEYQRTVSSGLFSLLKAAPSIDFIFWESGVQHPDFSQHPSARDFTVPELAAAEIKFLEKSLLPRVSLIYFIPSSDTLAAKQQASWISFICDEAGKGTVISFSSVAGNYTDDHLPPHPFWDQLRHWPDASSTPLLPLVNVGAVSQGEGLWPAPTFDLLDQYYGRLHHHKFAGVAVLSNLLPKVGSMLDCSLWTASQALWRNLSPIQLAETWFHAHRPDWSFADVVESLRRVRQLVVDLSLLRSLTCDAKRDALSSEDCRIISDGVLARLRDLKMRSEKVERKQKKGREHPSFSDYLQVFSRDAQRVVLHFLQSYHLSYPLSMSEADLEDSFWLQISPGAVQGIRSAARVAFFDEPRRGVAGSRMEAIFNENRLI